jgi:hypothetical protein
MDEEAGSCGTAGQSRLTGLVSASRDRGPNQMTTATPTTRGRRTAYGEHVAIDVGPNVISSITV